MYLKFLRFVVLAFRWYRRSPFCNCFLVVYLFRPVLLLLNSVQISSAISKRYSGLSSDAWRWNIRNARTRLVLIIEGMIVLSRATALGETSKAGEKGNTQGLGLHGLRC